MVFPFKLQPIGQFPLRKNEQNAIQFHTAHAIKIS